MFINAINFNNGGSALINNWNIITSLAVNMSAMFSGATNFNQPIGSWNTQAVTNMSGMFNSAANFNQNIGAWNVSAVTNIGNFMSNKTNLNYSSTNMDALLNGWVNNELKPTLSTNFGTIVRTSASNSSRLLMGGVSTTKTVTNATNNGSGLIRVTAVGHGLTTNNKVFIKSILGTTEANGLATVTVIDANNFDIQGSTFTNTYISGGTVITQYGWVTLPS
jgi:surface protein